MTGFALLWLDNTPLCKHTRFFICPVTHALPHWFYSFTIVTSAALNVACRHILVYWFHPPWIYIQWWVSGLHGRCIFKFMGKLHAALHKSCTNASSHQQRVRGLSLPLCTCIVLLCRVIRAILIVVRWRLIAIWACSFLMIDDVVHFKSWLHGSGLQNRDHWRAGIGQRRKWEGRYWGPKHSKRRKVALV